MVNKDVLDECSERMGADGEDLCALTDRCAAAMERAPTAIWATADAPGPQHGSETRTVEARGYRMTPCKYRAVSLQPGRHGARVWPTR